MKIGEVFNPYKLFVGVYIPNAMLRHKGLSHGAKITWGRLAQYAGENGQAWPSYETLAAELGIKRRQVITYVNELKEHNFIKTIPTGKSNKFIFLWHEVLEDSLRGAGYDTPEVQDTAPHEVQDTTPKENHLRESRKDLKEGAQKNPAPAPEKPSSNSEEQKTEKPEAKDQGSDIGQALGLYRELFELRTDRQPDIKDKDAAVLKKVVKKYGLKDTKAMLQLFFNDPDPFYKKAGYPLLTFCSQINRFLTKLAGANEEEPQAWNTIREWYNESEGGQEESQEPDQVQEEGQGPVYEAEAQEVEQGPEAEAQEPEPMDPAEYKAHLQEVKKQLEGVM